MHDPRPPYLEGHHPHHHHHHHCGLHNDNLPHIHNPNSHPDGLDCHHHHHDPSCGCHDHLPPDLHCLDVIPRFRFHEKDGETRGFHRTSVAYRDIILSALKNYPKLDEPAVAKAMWAFCKDIILRDEHGCCGVPVSEIDGESTHNICFTDHCGHELSKIQFYRTSNEAGVRIGVGEYSFGIRSFNGLAPETWTMYPSNPNSAQIARCDWVLDKMEDLLNEFLLNADEIPTQGSNNVVKSGGVYSWVLGLINQEIAERIAGDVNLQNQIDELKQRKNYDMHQYPHAGDTTQVVSCDGIYKYGQDILAAARREGGIQGFAEAQIGFEPKVGMIRQCLVNADDLSIHPINGDDFIFRAGSTVSGSRLFVGNHWFQVEGDDMQWSLAQKMDGSAAVMSASNGNYLDNNAWSIDHGVYNSTWVALSPIRSNGNYACCSGLFMCVSVTGDNSRPGGGSETPTTYSKTWEGTSPSLTKHHSESTFTNEEVLTFIKGNVDSNATSIGNFRTEKVVGGGTDIVRVVYISYYSTTPN